MMPLDRSFWSQRLYRHRAWKATIAISFCAILWLLYASKATQKPNIFDLPNHHECGSEIPSRNVAIIGEQGQGSLRPSWR